MSNSSTSTIDDDLVILDEIGNETDKNLPSPEIITLDDSSPEKSKKRRENKKKKQKQLKKRNRELRSELSKMKGYDSLTFGLPDQEPMIAVHFSTKTIASKYKAEIEKLLTPLLKEELKEGKSTNLENENFFIDTGRSSAETENGKNPTYPLYRMEMTEIMTDHVGKEENNDESESKPRLTCFNCLGDHVLSDCPKPPDRQNIAQNRQEFYNKTGGKQSRYHQDLENNLTKFRPGVLSSQLRKALNLGDNFLPLHIYKMRVLGYPPGWLCEAQVNSSGITMYDSEGKEIADMENLEEGEVNEPKTVKIQYDPKKLIDYPGFNVYPEQGTVDECVKLGFPTIQECHLKSSFERYMKPPPATPYKRKNDSNSLSTEKRNKSMLDRDEIDMDIENNFEDEIETPIFIEDKIDLVSSLKTEPEVSFPKQNDDQAKTSSEDDEENLKSISPSLEDLEEQKQFLMKQLQQTKTEKTANASKSTSLGTPILRGTNSCTKLPDSSKFAATISEHANFENLPNSTGSYDKMKTLLHKIRQRLT